MPARPRASPRSRSARRLCRGAAERPLLLRLGHEPQGPAQGQQPLHARRAAVPRPRRRAGPDPRGGARERLRPPRAARPRHPRRRRGDRPRPVRRRRRALHGRHRHRAAGLDRRRQGPRRPAQARHHRQRRPGAAQGPHPAHRPLRLLRRVRHPHLARPGSRWSSTSWATRSSSAPGSAPRSGCSSRRASPPRPRRTDAPPAVQGPRQGEDRRLGRGHAARALRRRRRRRLDGRGARGAHRRLPRDPDPLGDQADRRPDRAAPTTCG